MIGIFENFNAISLKFSKALRIELLKNYNECITMYKDNIRCRRQIAAGKDEQKNKLELKN